MNYLSKIIKILFENKQRKRPDTTIFKKKNFAPTNFPKILIRFQNERSEFNG